MSLTLISTGLLLAACSADDDCAVISGDLTDPDVERCAPSVQRIEGDLWIDASEGELTFPRLTSVRGSVILSPSGDAPGPSRLVFPALQQIGEGLKVHTAPAVESIELPVLETLGDLGIHSGPVLTDLALPKLRAIRRDLHISDPRLDELSLPALETMGGPTGVGEISLVTISQDVPRPLRRIAMPKLIEAFGINIEGQHALRELDLRGLVHLDSHISLEDHDGEDGEGLKALELPALERANQVIVSWTHALERVSLPRLRRLDVLNLWNNDALSAVQVGARAKILGISAFGNPMLCDLDELQAQTGADCSECEAATDACLPSMP